MADANDQPALNKEGGEEATPEAPPALEPKAPDEIVEPEAPEEEAAGETPEPGESPLKKPSKKGVQARIGKLTKRAKKAESKVKSLTDQMEETTALLGPQGETDPAPQPPTDPEQPILKPGEEIDTVELDKRMAQREQRILQKAQGMVNFQGKVNKVVNKINSEARTVLKKYPELDPNSETFNKELSDSVTAATEALVKATPTASVKNFVDKMMKPFKGAVTKKVGEAGENLAKQVSKTALKPVLAPKGDKKFSDLSIKEMEGKLGSVY